MKVEIEVSKIICCVCGAPFWVSEEWHKRRHEDGKGFYCPSGHPLEFRPSEADKLRKKLEMRDRQVDALKGELAILTKPKPKPRKKAKKKAPKK